ncbi:MAG: 2Fe-2S iron-sulfur cluster-binding protein, partial [Planctomycetota bacterium]
MSEFTLTIDGRDVAASEGMTLLEAARAAGIEVPTLCWHEALEPHGGCRLCMVELDYGEWQRLVVSCVYPAEAGLVVKTRTERLDRYRKTIVELLCAHAPESPALAALAEEYGADRHRYEAEADFCVHC